MVQCGFDLPEYDSKAKEGQILEFIVDETEIMSLCSAHLR